MNLRRRRRRETKSKEHGRGLAWTVLTLLTAVDLASGSLASTDRASNFRQPRLFSNPFGILGHAACKTELPNRGGAPLYGQCYNEVECIVKRGRFSEYCGPPAVTGVCCVFSTDKCDATVTETASYFTNPSYPYTDSKPNACVLKVKPQAGVCWIRFDLEDFVLASNANSDCEMDSMTIINSRGGYGGKICGHKKDYAYVAEAPGGEGGESLLGLSVVVQSPGYKWNIRVTQIKCSQVKPISTYTECGDTGATGFARDLSADPNSVVELDVDGRKVFRQKRRRKRRRRPKSTVEEVCSVDAAACDLMQRATDDHDELAKTPRHGPEYLGDSNSLPPVTEAVDEGGGPHPVLRRRLNSESFFPSFSSRDIFCKSKFRVPPVRLKRPSMSDHPSFKIIDGVEAPVNAFPWIASLQYLGQHFCGGSLITNKYVLTAAHCMEFGDLTDFLQELTIRLGDHDVSQFNETDAQVRRVAKVITYWRFSNKPSAPGDVSLLLLDQPVDFGSNPESASVVRPVCLPGDPSQTFERMLGVAAGWGLTETGEASDVLRQVELNIVPNVTCVDNLDAIGVSITADMICTFKGPVGTESICSGDSGGPLMVRSSGKFVLVGLSSFSVTDCAAPFPAVFSRVTFFMEWIKAVVSSK